MLAVIEWLRVSDTVPRESVALSRSRATAEERGMRLDHGHGHTTLRDVKGSGQTREATADYDDHGCVAMISSNAPLART
jgi:hypothetical protein